MHVGPFLTMVAFLSLVPAVVCSFRRRESRGLIFWVVTGIAVAGPLAWSAAQFSGPWNTGFSAALWLIITLNMVLFAALSAATRLGWRLAPLLMPYLLVLGLLAVIWAGAPERPFSGTAPTVWLGLHIFLSVAAYALLTIAAVAGLAVFLQERALKSKRRPAFNRLLPSVMDSERMELPLLAAAEAVLGFGLVSGMATLYFETGRVLALDHKTLLSLLAFLVIAVLLAYRARSGIRGKRAARFVLLSYLLLTLAYPGVKFVTDVVIG